jgi:hypothetical protein
MRILLSLLLLFGCGEDGSSDQQSEFSSFNSYESMACERVSERSMEREDYWFASIEGVHPTEVRVVICAPYRVDYGGDIVDGVQVCGSPQRMLYRDGSTDVFCRLESDRVGYHFNPTFDGGEGWVVYYKRL